MMRGILSSILALTLILEDTTSKLHMTITVKKLVCIPNPDYFLNVHCSLFKVNRLLSLVNIDGDIRPGLKINNVELSFSMERKNTKRPTYLFGIRNMTIDICRVLNGAVYNQFVQWNTASLQETSNLLQPCPYVGHLYLHNFTTSMDEMPNWFVPSGEYSTEYLLLQRADRKVQRLFHMISDYELRAIPHMATKKPFDFRSGKR